MIGARSSDVGVRLALHGGLLVAAVASAWLTVAAPVPWLPFAVLAGVGAASLVLARPEVGVLLIVVAAAVVPRDVLFDRGLPLAGGQLELVDVLVGLTVGAWLLGRSVGTAPRRLPPPAITGLVLALATLALVGLVHGVLVEGHELALFELKPLLAYLLIFPVVAGALPLDRLERGLWVAVLAWGTSAGVTVARYVETAATDGEQARVIGSSIDALLALVWALVLVVSTTSRSARLLLLAVASVAAAGLLVTYQRITWVAAVAAVALVAVLLRGTQRLRLAAAGATIVAVAALGATTLEGVGGLPPSRILDAGTDRISSLLAFEEDVSSRYRIAEWTRATETIAERPLFGIGLGGTISFVNPEFSPSLNAQGFQFSTAYIHNSYLWFALKLGLPALLLLLALLAVVLRRGLAAYAGSRDPGRRRILLGATVSLGGIAVMALAGPQLNDAKSTAYVAALIGLIAAAGASRDGDGERSDRPAPETGR